GAGGERGCVLGADHPDEGQELHGVRGSPALRGPRSLVADQDGKPCDGEQVVIRAGVLGGDPQVRHGPVAVRRRARRSVAVLALAGIVSTTGACSKPLSDRPADEPDLSQFVDAGPWAADFATAFTGAGAYERAVLHDGV